MSHDPAVPPARAPETPAGQPQGPVPEAQLLAGLPPVRTVSAAEVAARTRGGPRLAVLDDDPTGTQTVADVPVLTSWSVDDLRWALRQDSSVFFVLTNTRSLYADAAAERNREVVRALYAASQAEGVPYVLASRSDSTLRGHFPLETDVLGDESESVGAGAPDGVLVVPAYVEAGRLTVDSRHWMRTSDGLLPVGESEFARDATFGYRSSALPEWVEEKSGGRVRAADVVAVTLDDLRTGGPERVAGLLAEVRDGRTAVADAVCDDDLRVLALAAIQAEEEHGVRLLYRIGPSFVRARAGQAGRPPLGAGELRALRGRGAGAPGRGSDPGTGRGPASASAPYGLIAVGSHVGLTGRQLDRLRERGGIREFELDVRRLLDDDRRDAHIAESARAAAEALETHDTVIRTTRTVITGADAEDSLTISRRVSAALVETVRLVTAARRPAFVVAKGGITSSDTATHGLAIRRAWARGTLLPGIVSLWQPVDGPAAGIPYVVFPGNVGTDDALADALDVLRAASAP